MNQNIRKCTICEAHEQGFAPRKNDRLCDEHQDWDDILHVTFCKEVREQHPGVNPTLFCYKHNPDWPPNKKGGYSELKDLVYRSREYYRRRGDCLVCVHVRNVLETAVAERERDRQGQGEGAGGEEDVQVTIAIWRPFICDLTQTQKAVRDEQAAIEKGMLPWQQKCVLALCIATSTPPTSTEESETLAYEPAVTEFILHYERWCYDLSAISHWDRRFIDLSQIKGWLDRCTHEHGDTCEKSRIPGQSLLPHGFRLIDVEQRCVVLPERPSEYEYVTLSYVWAAASNSEERQKFQLQRSNLNELAKEGKLQDELLPEVVSDAMHLCRELEKRYLWVDRFCIVQDDIKFKSAQIDAMGTIYDGASLSIVALADGLTPGLPGIAPRPRQVTLRNWSWDLLAPMSNPVGDARPPWIDTAIHESRWNDRAWTFQERLFSKRSIYFDANHIYGTCGNERWVELPPGEDEEKWNEYARGQRNTILFRPSDLETNLFGAYQRSVNEFTPRKLTFAEDVMRAFAGVSAVYQMRLAQPILVGHPQEYFTESLRWLPQPGFTGRRRNIDFVPSWSWASWDGMLCWDSGMWTKTPGTYLDTASNARAVLVDFFFSDGSSGIKQVEEPHEPLDNYLAEQKRIALQVLKGAATSWWPSTSIEDPKTVELSRLNDLTDQVWNFAQKKATSDITAYKWPPSAAGTPTTERLHDLDEDATAMAALRNIEEYTNLDWWPPAKTKDTETLRQLKTLSSEACALARKAPNSLVFNTTCVKLMVGMLRGASYVAPPRRLIGGGGILSGEGANWTIVGITMAMSPELGAELFPKPRECLVALIGVCPAKRFMQWDKGERKELPIHHLNELCLLVMVLDEDKEGVYRRAAVGVVFANEWVKQNPEWRTIVLA